jgi:hypothetical protein
MSTGNGDPITYVDPAVQRIMGGGRSLGHRIRIARLIGANKKAAP